jgi:tRNA(Ser,Leu) C12 N-acetylase TAN1
MSNFLNNSTYTDLQIKDEVDCRKFPKEKPKAFATTIEGKEEKGLEEIENSLLPYDPYVKIVKTGISFLIIYSKLSPLEILGIVKSYRPSRIRSIVPLEEVTIPSLNCIVERAVSLFKAKGKSPTYCRCRKRLNNISCREVEMAIGTRITLEGLALINFKSALSVIYVEIYNSIAGITILPPNSIKFHKVNNY